MIPAEEYSMVPSGYAAEKIDITESVDGETAVAILHLKRTRCVRNLQDRMNELEANFHQLRKDFRKEFPEVVGLGVSDPSELGLGND